MKSVYTNLDLRETMTEKEMYDEENFMPTCRQCNFYKSTMTVEDFRKRLQTTMMNNLRKNFGYRLAVKYGLVEGKTKNIVFYFETLSHE